MANVINLFEGDPRALILFEKIEEVVKQYGNRMPLPTIIGVLTLFEHAFIQEQVK